MLGQTANPASDLRHRESVRDDEEAERAVERWVRLGDEVVTGKTGGERDEKATRACTACGTTFNVLASDDRALCARCFLGRATNRTSE